jgi:hypothetical protein
MSTIVQAQTTVLLESLQGGFNGPHSFHVSSSSNKSIDIVSETPRTDVLYGEVEIIEESCTPQQRTQNALVVAQDRKYQLIPQFPVPAKLGPEEVMIRNCATGLNHIDWKSVDYNFCLPELPWITGREMAGVIDQVGSSVTLLKPGDQVWTSKFPSDRRVALANRVQVHTTGTGERAASKT